MRNQNMLKLLLAIFLCFVFVVIAINTAVSVERPTLYWGTTGSDVKLVQSRLSAWGYYNGAIDGTYGNDTFQAVKKFQAKNGLPADGIVGDATWNALGYSTTPASTTTYSPGNITRNDDINLLARLIAAESEAEPYLGKVAVAATMLNRVNNPNFPKTIAANVFKPGEFESVSNGRINYVAVTNEDIRAAQDAFNGYDPTYGAIYFWNPSKPVSGWMWTRQIIIRIGNHVFAR